MTEVVYVRREATDQPFGFKLQGGSDFAVPLSILNIIPNSISDMAGLKPGDAIVKINDVETSWMEHSRAKQELIRSGNEIKLTIKRQAVDITKPQFTPLSQLKSKQPVNPATYTPPPPAPKTNLTVEKTEYIDIGTSHNRAPMPFNPAVGNSIEYKAAKPTNWKDGDYKKIMNNSLEREPDTVKAVFHNQYNTPIGMYSDSNVFQEFQNQTKSIMPELSNIKNNQTTSQFYANENQHKPSKPNAGSQIKGANSLSMKMLNLDLNQSEVENRQPASIFDLKRGNNPTGAVSGAISGAPKGFRSVQAPQALPPDQRHAPVRKEYQIQHVKQNWIEPKNSDRYIA